MRHSLTMAKARMKIVVTRAHIQSMYASSTEDIVFFLFSPAPTPPAKANP